VAATSGYVRAEAEQIADTIERVGPIVETTCNVIGCKQVMWQDVIYAFSFSAKYPYAVPFILPRH